MRVIETISALVVIGLAFTSVTAASPPTWSNNMLIEKSHKGYRLLVETPYKFNDQVTFASEYNGSGSGTIVSIDIALDGSIAYTIEMPDRTWQAGIAADEITLVRSAPNNS
ncbi:hypothetical protein [Halochromatium sp.]